MDKIYLKKRKKGGAWKWVLLVFLMLLLATGAGFNFLVVSDVAQEITVEAGGHISPEMFLNRDWGIPISFQSSLGQSELSTPGDYVVTLSYLRLTYNGIVHVRDTIKPDAVTKAVTALAPDSPDPVDFLDSVWDVTPVTAAFGTPPDMTKDGEQTVTILLTDEGGNTTEVSAQLTVILDNQPPVILGVQKEITVYQGDTVSYRAGVTVTDNTDENPELSIDSSQVDLSTPGAYTVTYIAVDKYNNLAVKESKINVLEKKSSYVDLETIRAAVREQLSTIVNDSMSNEQKARAIYAWMRQYCSYINYSNKDDYHQAGYAMLKTRSSDCFGFFALSKLMLEELGIPNIDVTKVKNYPRDNSHYWSLVSVDGGVNWYHFDTTPRVGGGEFCLVSDAFMDEYSENHKDCFNRDKSLYPATPYSSL